MANWLTMVEKLIGLPESSGRTVKSEGIACVDQCVTLQPGLLPSNTAGSPEPCDTVFVIDTSGSMSLSDFDPSRLDGAKNAVQVAIETLRTVSPDDRVALVAFTERAKIVSGLTDVNDAGSLLKHLTRLKAGGGTDIPAGLKAVRDVFARGSSRLSSPRLRRAVLLTDGYGGDPLEVASGLKTELRVLLEVIGVGGDPAAVWEELLREVATTDERGVTHYRFISDTSELVEHYRNLATGLAWKEPRS